MANSKKPGPKPIGRPRKFTPDVQNAVAKHVARHGWNPGACAVRANCSLRTLALELQTNADFADAIETAKGVFLASLEAEAMRRAYDGVETVKSLGKDGKPITVRVYSDPLLKFLLAANGREKYGQTIKVDKRVSGSVDHMHAPRIDVASLPAQDRAALRGLLQRNRIRVETGTGDSEAPDGGDDSGEAPLPPAEAGD